MRFDEDAQYDCIGCGAKAVVDGGIGHIEEDEMVRLPGKHGPREGFLCTLCKYEIIDLFSPDAFG